MDNFLHRGASLLIKLLRRDRVGLGQITVSILLVFAACSPGDVAENAHPQEARIVALKNDKVVEVYPEVPPDKLLASGIRRYLDRSNLLFEVGVVNSPKQQAFGKIANVNIGDDGSLYIVDSQARSIRLFDRNGEHLNTIGPLGPPPLRKPTAFIRAGEKLYVLDAGIHLRVYERRGNDIYFQHLTPLGSPVSDVCTINSGMFALSRTPEDPLIQRLSTRNGLLAQKGFGKLYRSKNGRVISTLRRGSLVCDKSARRIIYAPSFLGLLIVFTAEGRTLTTVRLAEFDAFKIREVGATTIRIGLGVDKEADELKEPVILPSGKLLLQFRHIQEEDGRWATRGHTTYTLDLERGKYAVDRGIAPVVAVSASRLVTKTVQPFPRLHVRGLSEVRTK